MCFRIASASSAGVKLTAVTLYVCCKERGGGGSDYQLLLRILNPTPLTQLLLENKGNVIVEFHCIHLCRSEAKSLGAAPLKKKMQHRHTVMGFTV